MRDRALRRGLEAVARDTGTVLTRAGNTYRFQGPDGQVVHSVGSTQARVETTIKRIRHAMIQQLRKGTKG